MTRVCLAFLLFVGVGCASGGESPEGPGGASDPSAAFVGTYAATFSATSTFSSPPGLPPMGYTDTGTITVTAKDAETILMAWRVGNNAPSGTIEFKVTGGSGSGTGGTPWMGRLSNGNTQTSWCDVCGASIMGGKLTQTQQGHFEGITPTGIPYAGTYVGAWSGTRAP
jgi:hypothetical protein